MLIVVIGVSVSAVVVSVVWTSVLPLEVCVASVPAVIGLFVDKAVAVLVSSLACIPRTIADCGVVESVLMTWREHGLLIHVSTVEGFSESSKQCTCPVVLGLMGWQVTSLV